MPNSWKKLVEEASEEDNVNYNLNALKYKMLKYEHDCAKCLQKCSNWTVLGKCHHIICNKCLDFKISGNTQCPKCLTKFNVGENSSNSDEMRKVYSAIEEMVYLIQEVEKNTLNETDREVLNNHKKQKRKCWVHNINNDRKMYGEYNTLMPQLREDPKRFYVYYRMTPESFDEILNWITDEIQKMPTNFRIPISPTERLANALRILSNFAIEPQESSNRSTQEARNESPQEKNDSPKQSKCVATLGSNSLSAISSGEEAQYKIQQLINNSDESENDVIEGTPDKSCVLEGIPTPIASTSGTQDGAVLPLSKSHHGLAVKTFHMLNIGSSSSAEQKSKNIVVTFTNLTDDEIFILIKVANIFNIVFQSTWTDTVTHLVTKQERDGSLLRTKKYMNAILSHCYIISFDWAVSCLELNSLLPEATYMVEDSSGEPSPLVSWKVGRGIVYSPLEWTKNCILFFHGSIENNTDMTLSDNIIWAKRAKFALASKLEDLNNDEYKMRFIIVDSDSEGENLVTDSEILSWIQDYKAVTVNLGWFLECLFRYRFLKITPEFQTMLLKQSILTDHTLMDESYFTFNE